MWVNIPNALYIDNNIWYLFISAITSSITLQTINGKEYYYISSIISPYTSFTVQDGVYIDKETGLMTKTNANEEGTWPQADYVYEFNNVTEEDLKEPDLSEYEIAQ